MRYIPHTESDIREMLSSIGIDKVDELFQSIPESLRLERPLNLPSALPEANLVQTLKRMENRNLNSDEYSILLGAGAYRHFTPSIVNHLILRGEFSTCYTPYQPEVSQGTLQAIFEFQSLVSLLMGMDIANASLYDGSTALAEAILMAERVTGGDHYLIANSVHPEYREVVKTYTRGTVIQSKEISFGENGQTDLQAIKNQITDQTMAVVLQSPNFFGVIEEYQELGEFLKNTKTLLIVVVAETTSLGILKPPGERGADIAVGEGQALGLPVSYGGPYVGLFACGEKFFRQVPGRIVGQTLDRNGNRAYALTLATREQHIRREKATSNICTNQGLCALAVTIYLTLMGKQGMRELAIQNLKHADYLKNRLAKIPQFKIKFSGDTYNEFVLECPVSAKQIQDKLLQEKIVAGLPLGDFFPDLENCLLVCATELTSQDEMDRFLDRLAALDF